MRISKRLQKIAEMVKHNTVVDIGTDHAHLPIYLAQNGLVAKVLATDVNAGPLAVAERNIVDAALSGMVLTRLCNGLDGVSSAEYAACVISGMGGGLIVEIIRQNLEVALGFKQLILSPQRDVPDLRLFLQQNGFRIDDEEILEEKGKIYNILDVSPGYEPLYDIKDQLFGKILLEKKPDALKKQLEIDIKKLRKIKRSEYDKILQLHEEVLACLSK